MKLFQYNWANFNARLGLIFMVAGLIFFNILGVLEFPVYPAGFAALLAWITIILVPGRTKKQYLSGMIVFLLIGIALTLLTALLVQIDSNPLWIFSLGVITFSGFMMLRKGGHHFMIAWCLVYWYLLVPLFYDPKDTLGLLIAFTTGTGLVIFLNLIPFVWTQVWKNKEKGLEKKSIQPDQEEKPPIGFVRRFAFLVSLSLMGGVAAGIKWLVTDPTLIANATINMISPSFKQTWIAAVERAILGLLGIVGGFYLGWYLNDPIVSQMVIAFCSFFALASLFVNAGLVVGIFFFLVAYGWGGMQNEQAHLFANEKILGELIGVAIAVIAIGLMNSLKRKETT